ncbi:MAG: glycosyltransferase [Candidatus Gastranaerophilales bacterium]|nr:glycosyltransferase [Candidatus Gastranaerophilales bacterium]
MQEFNPLVSIVIPVYNGSNFLRSAIDSAINQTYKNIEVIVVNDGSTDDTDKIAKSYGNKIRYFTKENGGVATALNLAIKEAKGEYISWLSHDDFYSENKIEMQINKLRELNCNPKIILFSDYAGLDEDNNVIKKVELADIFKENSRIEILKLLNMAYLHGCTLLIPKIAFEQISYFDVKLKTTQDYALWFKFVKKGYIFYHMSEILVYSRWHDNQDTRTKVVTHKKEQKKLHRKVVLMFFKDYLFCYDQDYVQIHVCLVRNDLKIISEILRFLRKIVRKYRKIFYPK